MKAAKLHARDAAKMKKIGWPNGFCSPELPLIKTRQEQIAQLLLDKFNRLNSVTIHVYDVLEMMEAAYDQGVRDGEAD